GQEDAIVALHESWERDQRVRIPGYLSGELLRVIQDPQAFVDIARYESAAAAQVAAADPEYIAWQQRLTSLTQGSMFDEVCSCVWRSESRR
ncbi:MAG: antibiotic biosynthesis monooxygenase, partial [Anaerolineae bacterium]|nr:antibiotic biosynthesis monooxygenase [Anaerolineae bacterium]